MAENDGTPAGGDGTQAPEGAASAAPANQAPASAPDVTTLLSRIAGLDAKVSTQSETLKAEKAAREAAEQKLADYEAGKVGADEALRAQLAAKDAELTATRQQAALARIEAKYPETYAVLGESAANLSAEQLAAAEARFKGVAAPEPTPQPKPLPNAQPRDNGNSAAASPADETSDDILKRLGGMLPDWMRGQQGDGSPIV